MDMAQRMSLKPIYEQNTCQIFRFYTGQPVDGRVFRQEMASGISSFSYSKSYRLRLFYNLDSRLRALSNKSFLYPVRDRLNFVAFPILFRNLSICFSVVNMYMSLVTL